MDDLLLREDGIVEYRWTFTGTSAETGKSVRIPGFEEWTIAPDGLIAESHGHYDVKAWRRFEVLAHVRLSKGARAAASYPSAAEGVRLT